MAFLRNYFSSNDSRWLSKVIKRLFIIVLSGFNTIAAPLSSMLLSFTVIYYTSTEFWGSMVYIIIGFDFAFNIISWGNKPYLVQEFSLAPRHIVNLWRTSFTGRSILLFLFIVIILLTDYSFQIRIYMIIWAAARYIYQSFEAIILFRRDFLLSLFLELTGISLLVAPVFVFQENLQLETLVLFFSLSLVVKSIVAGIFYKSFLPDFAYIKALLKSIPSYKSYFLISFPFLLLTFTGMLQSRMDLYGVAYFMDKGSVAQYQVYLGFLTFSQVTGSMMLSPYAKNIFRLNERSLKKLERIFISTGILVSILLIIGIYYILNNFYHFTFSFYAYMLGYFYILAFYLYLLKNYELGKQRKQSLVAVFSLLSAFINLLLGFILIPRFGVEGALLSGILSQLSILLMYYKAEYFEFSKKYFSIENKDQ